jgi:hypothetical protein
MDLGKIVIEKVNAVLDERLNDLVTKSVNDCIERLLKDMFGSYGYFEKQLKEVIQAGISLNVENVKLEGYSHRVIKIVEDEISKYLDSNLASVVANRIKDTCSLLDKDSYKLSEIVREFAKSFDVDRNDSVFPTIDVERSNYGVTYLNFDQRSGKSTYDCEYQIAIDDKGKVWSYRIRGYGGINLGADRALHGSFEKFIFALYANSVVIEIDDYETAFYNEED